MSEQASGLAAELAAGLAATSATEAVAVALGLAYVVLAALRSRWCWPAGGVSAALIAWLSWHARLPLQGLLQVWYVAMAVYGWTRWATPVRRQPGLWTWQGHAIAVPASIAGGLLLALFAGPHLASDWPRVDALTTVASLVATWLTARMRIESWIWWIVIDSVLAWLYARQGLVATAGLFVVYLGVCIAGLVSWTRQYRSNVSPA